jgi:hypothetical protein
LSRTGKRGRVHPLDEEIENEENRTQKKQYESRIDVPARKPAKRANTLRRHGLQPRLFPNAVKGSDHYVARKAAPERPELVVNPNGKVVTIAPNQGRANREGDVPQHS